MMQQGAVKLDESRFMECDLLAPERDGTQNPPHGVPRCIRPSRRPAIRHPVITKRARVRATHLGQP